MKIFYHHPAPHKRKPVPTVMAVKQHRPWLCPTVLFITIITVIVGGLYLWNTSVKSLRQNKQNFIERYLQENSAPLANLETKELQSKFETVVSTAENLTKSVNDLQEQRLDLTEELNFYKSLVTSKQVSTEVMVSSFALYKAAKSYIYKLVLTQNNSKVTIGTIQISLTGKINGKVKQLDMAAITKDSISAINYEINYFQRLTGEINLPESFMPEHLIIRLATENNKIVEKINFKWEELQPKE
ncbi:hypothetical protein QUF74_04670 [Candidatus Halobeggiatoa sp. HSG11]|nr:hypothetical protein [Candidatus Halobeggiatoa sp. HSG11]